jgi:hypothetical protein
MIRGRTSAGLAAAAGGARKLDDIKRRNRRGSHLRSKDRSTDGADVQRVAANSVAYRGCPSGRKHALGLQTASDHGHRGACTRPYVIPTPSGRDSVIAHHLSQRRA